MEEGTVEKISCIMRRENTLLQDKIALEILAAASLLQLPIYTYTSAGTTHGKYRWVCYKPLSESALTWFPQDEPYPRRVWEMSHIELLHSGGCHYDCIVDIEGESPLTLPN